MATLCAAAGLTISRLHERPAVRKLGLTTADPCCAPGCTSAPAQHAAGMAPSHAHPCTVHTAHRLSAGCRKQTEQREAQRKKAEDEKAKLDEAASAAALRQFGTGQVPVDMWTQICMPPTLPTLPKDKLPMPRTLPTPFSILRRHAA